MSTFFHFVNMLNSFIRFLYPFNWTLMHWTVSICQLMNTVSYWIETKRNSNLFNCNKHWPQYYRIVENEQMKKTKKISICIFYIFYRCVRIYPKTMNDTESRKKTCTKFLTTMFIRCTKHTRHTNLLYIYRNRFCFCHN